LRPCRCDVGQKKTSAEKARRRYNIVERRRQVALYLRQGLQQQEIADLLGVSDATVSSDVDALKAMYVSTATQEVAEYVAQERVALDGDEASLRAELVEATSLSARLAIYDRIIVLMRRRSDLLGLDSVLRRKNEEMRASTNELDDLLRRAVDSSYELLDEGDACGV
jgi:predicted transcriptional regulator